MLGATLAHDAYVERLKTELARTDLKQMQHWADLVYAAWQDEKFVFIFGNGGSGTTASHMAEDLGKSLLKPEDLKDEQKKRLKVLSLTDNLGWILAVGNDVGYDQIFVQQLMNYGSRGDLVVAISGSGNSPNVLAAVDWANRHGLKTFGLTGYNGGKLRTHGPGRPARPAGRHGHGREHPLVPVPLGPQRRLRPHQPRRPARLANRTGARDGTRQASDFDFSSTSSTRLRGELCFWGLRSAAPSCNWGLDAATARRPSRWSV